MKKTVSILVCAMMIVLFAVPSLALIQNDYGYPYVNDEADLLTDEEENMLDGYILQIRNTYNFDIAIITTSDLEGKSPMEYTDDYYDYNGFGCGETYDGCALLIHMDEDRGYWISGTGSGVYIINDSAIDSLGYNIVPYLKDGNYSKALSTFVSGVEYYVANYTADNGGTNNSYGTSNGSDYSYSPTRSLADKFEITYLLIGLIAGLITAVITTSVLKGQLKSVRFQSSASDYYVNDSLQMTGSYDRFVGRRISRVKIERESSSGGGTHTSSSGRSHSGGGGRF